MEDLKKYEKILENLGEESNNYDYVLGLVKDIKGKNVEEDIKIPEDFDTMEFISEEKDVEKTEDRSVLEDQTQDVNLIDPIVDQLFKNIDTDEYRQKRASGGFKPKFVETEVYEEEEEEIEIPEEELETIIGQSQDLFEIKSNIAAIESEINKIKDEGFDIDKILVDAKKVLKDVEKSGESLVQKVKGDEKGIESIEEIEYEEEIEKGIKEDKAEVLEEEKVEELEEKEVKKIDEEVAEVGELEGDIQEIPFEEGGIESLEEIEEKEATEMEEISELEPSEIEEVEDKIIEEKEAEDIDNLKSFVEGQDYSSDLTFDLQEEEPFEEEIEIVKKKKEVAEVEEEEEVQEIEQEEEKIQEYPVLEEKEEIKEELAEEKPTIEEEFPIEEEYYPEEKEVSEEEKTYKKELEPAEEEIKSVEEFEEEKSSFEDLEKEYKDMGFEIKETKKSEKDIIKEKPVYKEPVREREERKVTSDKLFQSNLNRLPVSLMLKLKEVMSDPYISPKLKQNIKAELTKEKPDIEKIKDLLGYEEKEAKNFVPVFRFATILIVLGILISILYFTILKPYLRDRELLLSGLEDIKNGNYILANEKFERANPSIKWYNRYAVEFMKYNAYKQAEEKLMGIRGPGYEVVKIGAVDIDPNDRETRLNIARVFEEQGMFEKVLENDVDPKMQFDDSLYYLHKKDPEDFSIVDKIGLTYVKWGNSFRKRTQRLEKYQKANEIYTKFYENVKKEPEVISRILYTAALIGDKVEEKFDYVQSKAMFEKMHDITLAQVGMYFIDNEEYKRTQKIIEVLNNMETTHPYVYYMMGRFYYNIGNFKLSEKALVKAERFSWEIENDIKKKVNDEKLYSNIMNMLGTLYVSLANEYRGENEENKKKREEFIQLAYYHFNQAKKYDPNNKETYYRYASMMYDYYSDYLKASENYLISYNLYREEEEVPPLDMYYKLSASFYFLGDYDKSLEYLNDLRMNPSFRVRPAIEYLLGMLYFKKGMLLDARQRFINTQEYYNKEIESYIRSPNPMSIRQNRLLFFNSILNNNIGVVYHILGDRENNPDYYNIARVHFYKAMELAHRYNNKAILALARLNLNDSIFQDNIKYVEHFNIKRDPILYDYIPKYLEEYE